MYQIMRSVGQIETLLGLAAHTKADQSKRKTEPTPLIADSADLFDTRDQ